MAETKILETFRLDFTYLQRDADALCKLFNKYGYPNLVVSTEDSYDGLWRVYNKRNNTIIWSGYHSGFVTFFKEDDFIKIAFDYKGNPKIKDYTTFVYFEDAQSITDEPETVEALRKKVLQLEAELAQTKEDFKKYKELHKG